MVISMRMRVPSTKTLRSGIRRCPRIVLLTVGVVPDFFKRFTEEILYGVVSVSLER